MAEDLSLDGGIEPIQRPTVLLNDQLSEETDSGSAARQPLSHAQRDADGVTHATVGLQHQRLAVTLSDQAGQCCYHGRPAAGRSACRPLKIQCVRAMATPSAASDGAGAALRRSSWATI